MDFLGEYSAGIFGHSNPVIAAAVNGALKDGWNFGGPNVHERRLAEKVSCQTLYCRILLNQCRLRNVSRCQV